MGERRIKENEYWDPANIAATYFALTSLAVLGDNLGRVRRKECLRWLKQLQLQDGTFGEALSLGGEVRGERDMRFCYCAAAIRWILGVGDREADDIDVDGMMWFFEASQTYEGGFANGPFHEAQAGWTYCALSAMFLLGKLPSDSRSMQAFDTWPSAQSFERLLGWLVSRQTSLLLEEEEQEEEEEVDDGLMPTEIEFKSPLGVSMRNRSAEIEIEIASCVPPEYFLPEEVDIELSDSDVQFAGLTGRCNKPADTCYTFWAGGSLAILNKLQLIDQEALRQYLFMMTQHQIGGFGKLPGDPPDIMHSCLGLTGLAGMGHPDLKALDPSLCISVEARQRVERLPFRSLETHDERFTDGSSKGNLHTDTISTAGSAMERLDIAAEET
ncbi:MAG: hypothetical protein Q9216_000377 [Gyalolechia sp. 2 TL-2023]